jgi:predicted phosphoribosyltransferase
MTVFIDRYDAGRRLGEKLGQWAEGGGRAGATVVLGLARGGVPVACEVARTLRAPLDVFIVRKVGVPGHEEFAMGAIASGGVRVVNEAVVQTLNVSVRTFDRVAAREAVELERREKIFREGRPAISVKGATVILVDDGVATGASMVAGARAIRELGARTIVAAAPLVASDAIPRILQVANECVAIASLDDLGSVGAGYLHFEQTSDDEVRTLLNESIPAPTS